MIVRAYAWEIHKLLRQKRTFAGLIAAVLYAAAFVVVLRVRADAALPPDIPLASQVKHTAAVLPLALLSFATFFGAPVVASIVPGDIVASEDSNNTLKMILTRSAGRGTIYFAKALASATYGIVLVATMLIVSLAGSTVAFGVHPATLEDGTVVGGAHAVGLTVLAYGAYLFPIAVLIGIAFFLSTVTRNAAAAIIGTVLFSLAFEGVAVLPGLGAVRPFLLPAQYSAWESLFHQATDASILRSAVVCAVYVALPLVAGWIVFRRRDVAGA